MLSEDVDNEELISGIVQNSRLEVTESACCGWSNGTKRKLLISPFIRFFNYFFFLPMFMSRIEEKRGELPEKWVF
jgi:hypothetical protein